MTPIEPHTTIHTTIEHLIDRRLTNIDISLPPRRLLHFFLNISSWNQTQYLSIKKVQRCQLCCEGATISLQSCCLLAVKIVVIVIAIVVVVVIVAVAVAVVVVAVVVVVVVVIVVAVVVVVDILVVADPIIFNEYH